MENQSWQFAQRLLAYAVQRNLSPEQVCSRAGIDWAALRNAEKPALSAAQLSDLWVSASQLSHDPLFGLHFGESMQLAALGLVGQLIQTSSSVGDALTQAARFIPLLTDLFGMTVTRAESVISVRFVPDVKRADRYPFMFRQLTDLALVFVLYELDGLVLARIKPLSVTLPYVPANRAEYERILRCSQLRQADACLLTFDDRYWHEPILTANYDLQRVLLQQAESQRRALGAPPSLTERVHSFLITNAYLSVPSLDEIAANLNVSTRSLQRGLQHEGVTYQQLADRARQSLAVHYLKAGQYPLKEIAYLLGYNELSAFSRAFKRWTGITPISYRGRYSPAD